MQDPAHQPGISDRIPTIATNFMLQNNHFVTFKHFGARVVTQESD